MATISPFKGVLYNKEKIKDISALIAPPYDVIDEAEREKLYARDENNIIRVILGRDEEGDNPSDNRYTRAAQFIKSGLADGLFKEDQEPCLYMLEQEFTCRGTKRQRRGFFALLKFDRERSAKPHENTYQKPKDDRLALLRATMTNTEPVFGFYDGELPWPVQSVLVFEARDDQGVLHRLKRVSDKAAVSALVAGMKKKNVYIADGHHRFETALSFAKDMGASHSSDAPHNYIMMYFTGTSGSGLAVLPIHRILKLGDEDIDSIMNAAKKYFLIVEIDSYERIERSVGHVMGFYSKKLDKLFMFKLRDAFAKDRLMQERGRLDQKDLDVSILHTLLLDDILAKHKDKETSEVIVYSHDEAEALNMAKKGRYNAAFLLRPTGVDQIIKAADAGLKMPQKSTFFYPKLASGLLMRRIV
ncbi:MAG: DUF1015 domain-containing protein [Candidatus Margulisiibacteriota bacterium]